MYTSFFPATPVQNCRFSISGCFCGEGIKQCSWNTADPSTHLLHNWQAYWKLKSSWVWVIFFITAYSANVFGHLLAARTRFSPFCSSHLQNPTMCLHNGSFRWWIFLFLPHLIELNSTFLYKNQWSIWLNWSLLIYMHTRSTVRF